MLPYTKCRDGGLCIMPRRPCAVYGKNPCIPNLTVPRNGKDAVRLPHGGGDEYQFTSFSIASLSRSS